MKIKFAATALALLAPCAAAQAQQLTEKDFLGEMPVVLSVSRLPQPLNEAPGAVTIIDREMIRRSGARELNDVLRLVPGFQTAEVRGGNPVAAYHGTFFENSNRLQVLIDGRSVYSPLYTGTASIGARTVSLEDIERVEVLRGSNSATYGARAVLGVINIVTRDTAETLGGAVQVTAGERDIADLTARIGWGNESSSFRLSADRRGDAGFSEFDRNRLANLNFRGDLRVGARDTIELRAGASDQRWTDGFTDTSINPVRPRRYYGGYFQADWRRSLSTDEELRLSFSHNEEYYKDRYQARIDAAPAPFTVDFSGRGRVDALELNHRFAVGRALRVSWGGEWRVESTYSEPLYATAAWQKTRFARLNGNLEWRMRSDLLLNAGLMYEDNSATGGDLLPRVMLNWLAAPEHTLRAGVSRAHRPPSTFERASNQRLDIPGAGVAQNWLATPGLRPEKLTAVEAGYYGDWRSLRATLDARIFDERVKDFVEITEAPVPASAGVLNPTASSFVNGRTLRMRGAEYQLAWRPLESTRLLLSQSYVDTDFPIDGSVLSVPRNTTALGWFQRLPDAWDFALIHSHIGAMTWSGTGGMLTSHHRTDLRLARAFRLLGSRAEAAVVVQSAGGAYQEYLPRLEFGRRAFATLRVAFD
jgi:iron complex outermembrane receptor protein